MSALCVLVLAATLPFRWTPGQIEIEVSVNGKPPIWFIVDTGAEYSILDIETSKAMGLKPSIHQYGRDFVEGARLSSGSVAIPAPRIMLMPLDNFRRQKREIRGVVGYDFFERYVVTIDFEKQKLIVSEPSSFRTPANAVSFPLTFRGRVPATHTGLTIGDQDVTALLMIDTGASQAVMLRHPFTESHGLFRLAESTSTSDSLAHGPTAYVQLPARELRLGRWKFANPNVKANQVRSGSGAYTETDGILGNDILRRFRVTFDYARKRMLLEPTASR